MATINVALIGQGFMGRSHSNAGPSGQVLQAATDASDAHRFWAAGREPAGVCGQLGLEERLDRLGAVCSFPEIGLVDIVTPNYVHAPVAGGDCRRQARRMREADRRLAGRRPRNGQAAKAAKVKTFVWFNYRRCPAVAWPIKWSRRANSATIRHVRACYLQDWADEAVPLVWRFDKNLAGSGAHGDLNAHIIDMARFVTGQEITEVAGAIAETFIKERTLPKGVATGGIAAGREGAAERQSDRRRRRAVPRPVLRRGGGQLRGRPPGHRQSESQRLRDQRHEGPLKFDFERMNELKYYDATLPRAVQGWSTIMCTHGGDHPYVANWWPDAHVIGYEHGFTNQAYDILRVLAGEAPTVPIPDFEDAIRRSACWRRR